MLRFLLAFFVIRSSFCQVTLSCAAGLDSFLTDLENSVKEDVTIVECSQGDRIIGEIPAEIADLTNLIELNLEGNSQMTGTFPDFIYSMTSLEVIRLSISQLRGPLNPELANLVNLRVLAVDQTQLSGEIPDIFQNFPADGELRVAQSCFEGTMPEHQVLNTDTPAGFVFDNNCDLIVEEPPPDNNDPEQGNEQNGVNNHNSALIFVAGAAGASLFILLGVISASRARYKKQRQLSILVERIASHNPRAVNNKFGQNNGSGAERVLTILTLPTFHAPFPGRSSQASAESEVERERLSKKRKKKKYNKV
eukprot:maker-scaffold_19-snap-gene-1.7-mRNA-1 protein AED:0.34 eAED:0.34 QI:112/1/1/1/1/1/2/35/307